MRILFICHSFNSLTQRLFVELRQRGHRISIEFDINDAVTAQAVELFRPELIIAPFLKRPIASTIWQHHRCIIVHPGIAGDRGPSSLDWAIMDGESRWGVTCIEANAELDGGDIWASVEFPLRPASKSSLYRNEVTEAAVRAVLLTIERLQRGCRPQPQNPLQAGAGGWRGQMTQQRRRIDWQHDNTEQVLTKIRAADSTPGVRDQIGGRDYFLFNAFAEDQLNRSARAAPGRLLATRQGAICRATVDGAVWITHLRLAEPEPGQPGFKLPATQLLEVGDDVPESELSAQTLTSDRSWQDIRYRQRRGVGYLYFDFYNGAMDCRQCQRLLQALRYAKSRDIRVLVLMGGGDFWCNGIHLNQIEAAASPADESWRNINAMDDLCEEIINSPQLLTVAAMQGSAGAGGVFLALCADRVVARRGVVLNPHYKSMGNLYGSEYWTYQLPKRVGEAVAKRLTRERLPIGTDEALALGLLDDCFGDTADDFVVELAAFAEALVEAPQFHSRLQERNRQRARDWAIKPLVEYRREELQQMKLNFYGFDSSYHVARYHFVEKLAKSRTPVYLALHRRLASTGD